ncbi:NUDIX domain-containing protein [Hazenella sp. IB182353]|uniref:NUDIX hydrolase n=1 Tax=Polycladospora coralii TaxID=2771432 RepID=UPI0017470DCC|nr:NUDIX domain-containing protein [Polycladospora coralii]MBS7530098.1 NUDIX domain-containing protein [Polycladospora coralii]
MKEISAGGVVFRNTEKGIDLLLIEDRYGKWTLPKGKREAGETCEENALREIAEETGIQGEIVSFIQKVHYQYKHDILETINKEVTYYLVEAKVGIERPQLEEISDVTWFSPKQAWLKQIESGYSNNQVVFEKAYHLLGLR